MSQNVLQNAIANAVNETVAATPNCNYCGTPLTAEEHANHLEAGETEFMCDKCAMQAEPEPTPEEKAKAEAFLKRHAEAKAAEEQAAQEKAAALAAEIARLTEENARLAAAKAKAAGKPAPAASAKPAPSAAPPAVNTTGFSKGDAMILTVIAKFKSGPRPDGKVPGALSVKVHDYFYACGIPKEKTQEILKDAEKRGIISTMPFLCTKGPRAGKNMMLLFDARERPANTFVKADPIPATEKAAMQAAFLR